MNKLLGHSEAIKFFDAILAAGKISGSYLITGPSGVGKKSLIRHLISQWHDLDNQAKIVNDPDVYWVEKNQGKKEITIEQIRQLSDFVNLASWTKKIRVVVITNCELMNAEAANALLKTLEEPPLLTVFLLSGASIKQLPVTIISRCQVVNLSPLSRELIGKYIDERRLKISDRELLVRLAQGRPGRVDELMGVVNNVADRHQVANLFIDYLISKKPAAILQFSADQIIKESRSKLSTTDNITTNDKLASLLNTWLEVARDLLFTKYQLDQLVVYEPLQNNLNKLANLYQLPNIYSIIKLLGSALFKLKANANTKLTLEWLLISIKNI